MFNKLLHSRINRLIHNDRYLPVQCFSLWWFPNDEKCSCKNYCKYSQLNKKDMQIIIDDSVSKIHKYHIDNQTSKLL